MLAACSANALHVAPASKLEIRHRPTKLSGGGRMKKQLSEIVRVGVDLAKAVMQVHAVDSEGVVVVARQLQRSAFLQWCSELPIGCVVAMEASCNAHYWGRRLTALGLAPRLISPALVTPYRMEGPTGKTDANDAAAICEAASRPQMRFVPVKTPTQQAWLALHAIRTGYVKERTSAICRLRGVLGEFGVLVPVSASAFCQQAPAVVEEQVSELPPIARAAVSQALDHLRCLEERIAWCDKQIRQHVRADENARRAISVCGVGTLGASALAASLGDLKQFANGRQFGAWLGLTPRMRSSGGACHMGSITKRGDLYLRKLLIIGARNALTAASGKDDAVSKWAIQLKERIGWPKACVALANKNARMIWSVVSKKTTSAYPRGWQLARRADLSPETSCGESCETEHVRRPETG